MIIVDIHSSGVSTDIIAETVKNAYPLIALKILSILELIYLEYRAAAKDKGHYRANLKSQKNQVEEASLSQYSESSNAMRAI